MKKIQAYYLPLLALLSLTIGGCEIVGTIFEAGFWSAFILIGVVVFIILAIVFKAKK